MKKSKIAAAISATLLTVGVMGTASAHDIIGGVIQGGGNKDVYRTTCFGWNTTNSAPESGPSITYDSVVPAGEVSGHTSGYRFAVNLYGPGVTKTAHSLTTLKNNVSGVATAVTTTTSSVSATVGFTSGGNISNALQDPGADPSNYGPSYSPVASFLSVSTSTSNTPWTNTTAEPDFTSSGASPAGWSTAKYLNNGTGTGDGEYVITIENTEPPSSTSNVLGYDFVGHCQNAATYGTLASVHTGQGTWFVKSANAGNTSNYTPSFDYDQVQDE